VGERQNRALNRAALVKSTSTWIILSMTGFETNEHSEMAAASRDTSTKEGMTLTFKGRRQAGAKERRSAVCQ
jgi:hypothetical protein